jgi:hypothetical protein
MLASGGLSATAVARTLEMCRMSFPRKNPVDSERQPPQYRRKHPHGC